MAPSSALLLDRDVRDWVLVPDLLGDRYRGAEVAHAVIDWAYPHIAPIARHRKWIRSLAWSDSMFIASMEGRS